MIASRTVPLTRASTAPADSRQRVRGSGIHYRITAGSLAGYLVPEKYPSARMRGLYAGSNYPVSRTVTLPAGSISGYRVSEPTGATSSPVTARLTRPTSAPFDRAWVVGGRMYVHITRGTFVDRWVPSAGLTLR